MHSGAHKPPGSSDFTSRNCRDDTLGWTRGCTHVNVYLRFVLLTNGKQSKCGTKEELTELMQWLVNCSDHGLQLDIHCTARCSYKWNQIFKKQNLAVIHVRHRHFLPFYSIENKTKLCIDFMTHECVGPEVRKHHYKVCILDVIYPWKPRSKNMQFCGN